MNIQSARISPCGCPYECSKGPMGALRVFERLVASLLARLRSPTYSSPFGLLGSGPFGFKSL